MTRLGYQIPNFTYPDVAAGELFAAAAFATVSSDTQNELICAAAVQTKDADALFCMPM